MTRVLAILTFCFVVLAGTHAEAQVFKPRGGKANAAKTTKKAPVTKPSQADDEKPTKKARRNTTAAKAPKKARAADAARPSDLTPKGKKGAKKGKAAEDTGATEDIADAGDDEVIITDDDE